MKEEIINRVANSKLVVIDLEDYYPEGERILFDIKDWLYEGFVLREKDFRNLVKEHDWAQYKNQYIETHTFYFSINFKTSSDRIINNKNN